jgi:hypothetical protein
MNEAIKRLDMFDVLQDLWEVENLQIIKLQQTSLVIK